MDKIETYKPDIHFEDVEAQIEEIAAEPVIVYRTKKLGVILLVVLFYTFGIGSAFGLILLDMTPQFLTDQDHDAQMLDAMNQSFINGTSVGMQYTIASLTQEAVQCKTIPIEYANYSYTLVAAECLDLNTTQEVK